MNFSYKKWIVFVLVLGTSYPALAITIEVRAEKSCKQVVGVGFSTALSGHSSSKLLEDKNFGGAGRSYKKSGMPSGNTFNFGFAQGSIFKRKNRSCGHLVLRHSVVVKLKCSADNHCSSYVVD